MPIRVGFVYPAVVPDAFSRRVIGWVMGTNPETQLVLDAMNMAVARRKPKGVIHHGDQGSQYTSAAFARRCKKTGPRPAMGPAGD